MTRLLLSLLLFLTAVPASAKTETAILAGGCFWCVESNFESVPGVQDVISGFTGGAPGDATYDQVSSGGTGHYEAVKILFDPHEISYRRILDLFFRSSDPLDAGGQFCDRGKSYRTAIFVLSPSQGADANAAKAAAEATLGQKVVTEILDAGPFYDAEPYHQNYYRGTSIVLTRRGPMRQAKAYAFYRKACGRDARVKELWGSEAAFVH